MFKHKLKPYLVDGKYKVIPAFSIGGVDYWMYDSALEIPTGRFFAAMGVYTEMEMNCNKEYMLSHCKAMEKLLSDPKKISLQYIMQLNINLRERLDLMPMPDYIYKLASVVFFDKSESLYSYDYEYNKKKIEIWKAAGGSLDFFSKTPLVDLVPSLTMPEKDTQTYLTVTNMVAEIHRKLHTDILLEEQ
jgi:triacylglycerol esterase/lipase EstA (alpha/beta hydrolase family)